ncbi:MAG: hypothetical protein J1E58_07985 [Prevotella sp.]|nr:hypothetical protein [Prevotella sp.]
MKRGQKVFLEMFEKNEKELTWAQKMILKRAQKKMSCAQSFQDKWEDYEEFYGADYNDCHGDYYDAEAEN